MTAICIPQEESKDLRRKGARRDTTQNKKKAEGECHSEVSNYELRQAQVCTKNWRESDPFENTRIWSDGSLPSFKQMGAIGKALEGGIVIYAK